MIKQNTKWVTAWGNAISIADRRPENYAKNLTLRYPIKMMLSGEALRITLDNFCGTEAVGIDTVTIAVTGEGNQIRKETSTLVTFGGQQAVEIPKGERVVSDAIPFQVHRGENIAVSIYLKDFTEMRSAVLITGPLSKGYYSVGAHCMDEELPLNDTRKTDWFYFLSDIEVLTATDNHSIVCYGDSITAQAWPDYLALRVLEHKDANCAIVRKAASGTRILRQYDNITYDSYGLKGSTRFPRELQVSGADTVIIQHGINDIIHPVGVEVNPFRPWSDLPTADDLIQGLRAYIEKAREYQLKVYMGTLLPIYGWRTYEPFREELKNQVNEWIRTTDEIDGCIDFDKAVRDNVNIAAFGPGYDSGDHLHPSLKAYEKMASIVPESLFL